MTPFPTLLLTLLFTASLASPTPCGTTATKNPPHLNHLSRRDGPAYKYNGLIPFFSVTCASRSGPTRTFSNSDINAVFATATSPSYDYGTRSFNMPTSDRHQDDTAPQPAWAPGCDTNKRQAYIPIGDITVPTSLDIVVFSVDTAAMGLTYCGVMTNSDVTNKAMYRLCSTNAVKPAAAPGAPSSEDSTPPLHPSTPAKPYLPKASY